MAFYLTAIAALLVLYIVYKLFWGNKRDPRSPPCLPSLPLIGSLPFLNNFDKLFLCLTEKRKQYGDVYAFYSASHYTVVLNGYDAIREALLKRSSDFVGRYPLYADRTILNLRCAGFISKQYDDVFKRNQQITMSILKQYGYGDRNLMEIKIQNEISQLVAAFNSRNGSEVDPLVLIEKALLNVIYNLLFGERLESDEESMKFIRHTSELVHSAFDPVLFTFPIAAHLPVYKKLLSELSTLSDKIITFYHNKIQDSLSKPESVNNFIKDFVEQAGSDYDENELVFILRDILLGGTGSTAMAISWAILYLANNPDIQDRAQKEIDSVVSTDRLPSLSDKASLPYTEAFMLETLRIRALGPLGAPHVTLCDTEVAGYKIPANTLVIANIWSAQMDPNVWSDPEQFKPERFLDDTGAVTNRHNMIAFSIGKRACLGEVLGRQEVFLVISALLQNFTALPPEGQASVRNVMSYKGNLRSLPFKVRLLPRKTNSIPFS